ncbi:hypothetical protein GLOIN_2v1660580 [Rhizophagus irregularis DAOM 181602=DAOM 197198]|uniref:Uncharacterized protein n=1 Tax=Rhizophagus irregularis (strain DAOM 181602 / DAOM 197198 / MUCL 43194) TaxID=747089 RepID=A0A2P4PL71_RHIID|nr:hypothetical protein GLOIN_2v1660580 [Rhizophagus irregularis DAOM 181602=DAOM 197198]POG66107.1 hypothetical protein GLOIN_2v1660580 [Rhizophagus irregularis DAOM 181602=DAOM 197198]|eukprot:XP_025172973.1 hypothetical protein GLOIN_2v1660580 [Rhizophagus irregularis DAOM 181602=DAOM 197198]
MDILSALMLTYLHQIFQSYYFFVLFCFLSSLHWIRAKRKEFLLFIALITLGCLNYSLPTAVT